MQKQDFKWLEGSLKTEQEGSAVSPVEAEKRMKGKNSLLLQQWLNICHIYHQVIGQKFTGETENRRTHVSCGLGYCIVDLQ